MKGIGENPAAGEAAELGFGTGFGTGVSILHPLILCEYETGSAERRGRLSSSVVTWNEELDLSCQSELEAELALFYKPLNLNLGLREP